MGQPDYRRLPSVSALLEHPRILPWRTRIPHDQIADVVRAEVDHLRMNLTAADVVDPDTLADIIVSRIEQDSRSGFPTVINATGVVLHTNLGRAPMAEQAAQAAYRAAKNYLALEIDLATGERSSRQNAVRSGLCRLTGAEAATVVNNCAAATVLALRVVAAGREVIVSRGQLVEIGGSFRIPEILSLSGARLREVGTTNITRLADYEQAVGQDTAALLRVHTGNFRIRGYTKSVGIDELAALGRRLNVPVIDDVGSGLALDLAPYGFIDEPQVRDGIAAGVDLVLFSGDKLLGGPQAGIIAGRAHWIDAIERDPLMRAMRCDKMTLAALETTLNLHRDPAMAMAEVPTLRMLATPADAIRSRCESFIGRLPGGLTVKLREESSFVGGGSLPDQPLATVVLALRVAGISESDFAIRLRNGMPPVLARVKEGEVLLDLRTVFADQENELIEALMQFPASDDLNHRSQGQRGT